MTSVMSYRRLPLALLLAAGLGLGGCGGGGTTGAPGYGGLSSPGVGTAAGAVGGAALGRWVAGGNNNMAAILGGAALGGLAGNVFADKPSNVRKQQEAEVARSAEQQRQLDYERQSQLQKEEVNKQIEDQRLFDEWKAQRGGGAQTAAIPATTSSEDVVTAQRLLTALGYYRGPVDGMSGGQTRSAVMQFEQAQGLPQTGVVTPALISRMRSVL
jgi:hypothetical protein